MRENVALRYGFSYFRQARPDIPCENTRYVRLETDFRSKETRQVFFSSRATRWLYLSSKIHAECELVPFNTNHHLSVRFVYLKVTSFETMWNLPIITKRIEGYHKLSPETSLTGQFVGNRASVWCCRQILDRNRVDIMSHRCQHWSLDQPNVRPTTEDSHTI